MMEDWEYRYRHERAVRNAQMLMLGLTPPEDEYGKLTPSPEICLLNFRGPEFWEAFKKEDGGVHTSTNFNDCKCHR
jgi:hypothetical protein